MKRSYQKRGDTKKVLIIANEFPPKGWSGVHRTTKFARYLPAFNWTPLVLTTAKSFQPIPMDPSLLNEVAHVKTEYANMLSHDDFIRLWRGIGTIFWPILHILGKDPEAFVQGVRWRYSAWLCPDHACTWIFPAVLRGLRIIRQQKPNIIFATAPPHSSLVIGMILSKLTRRPFIADFRDLWMDNFDRRPVAFWRNWADPMLENMTVSQASKIITTTHSSAETLSSHYLNMTKDKFVTIYNGYDSADFHQTTDVLMDDNRMVICHVGSLYGKRTPEPFLNALKLALTENPGLQDTLKVRFIGNIDQFSTLFRDRKLSEILETTGAIAHNRAIKNLVSADVLLLIMEPGADVVIPGKIFEYFAARKPILACVPVGGEAASLLIRHGGSTIVDLTDVQTIKESILRLHNQWSNGGVGMQPNDIFISQFERRELTRQLAEILDEHTIKP